MSDAVLRVNNLQTQFQSPVGASSASSASLDPAKA
jgi:hypothetical protein